MLKLLLVEDEVFTRKNLKNAIESKNPGYTVVADVGNGKMALEFLEKNDVDIILTDIAMPVMDGMELIKNVRESGSKVKIIILSCINELEYVKKALKYGVDDYFLKVETRPEELFEKIKAIEQDLIVEKQRASELLRLQQNLDNNRYLVEVKFLKDLLWGPRMAEPKIQAKVNQLGLKLNSRNLFVIYLELDGLRPLIDNSSVKEIELLDFSVLNIMSEILENNNTGNTFIKGNGQYVAFCSFPNEISQSKIMSRLKSITNEVLENMHKYFSVTLTAGISEPHSSFTSIVDAYNQAQKAFLYRFFVGKNRVAFYSEIPVKSSKEAQEPSFCNESILVSFEKGNVRQAEDQIDESIQSMLKANLPEQKIRNFTADILFSLSRKVESFNGNIKDICGSYIEICNTISQIDTCSDLMDWLFESIEALHEYYLSLKQNISTANIIGRIKEYVEINFNKNINLNSVANYFDMNPCYISLIFKEKTGENFIDFLSAIRIEKAKSLLRSSNLPMQNIGEMVGYASPQYFSKVFKKATGMSPFEYKTAEMNLFT